MSSATPSDGRPKLRKNEFKARSSYLDYATLEREKNPFRGFFNLFWVSMGAYLIVTAYKHWKHSGMPVSLTLFFVASEDLLALALIDGAMVLSMFVAVLMQKLIILGFIPRSLSLVFQHLWQVLWFSTCILVAYWKHWPWIQSGVFVMHTISMLLKQHSYSSYNIELNTKHHRFKEIQSLVGKAKKSETPVDQKWLDEIKELAAELQKDSVSFPNNVTFLNFVDYLALPTLVYELEYPRTETFRLWYFLDRLGATFCSFALLYVSYEHYIYPVLLEMPNLSFFDSLIQLLLPFMVVYLLIFYIIFECICNGMAELTMFADRGFYEDWWNSATFDEFARKWNKPVHEFLLRHIYLESITNYKLSRTDATFLTFFLSSCLHELVLLVVGKRLRLWFFGLQMFQIPLIYIGRIPAVRKRKVLGNLIFWFGMFLGPPLLAVVYLREHYC